MNMLAEAIGMDPWEIRFINAWREGDTTAIQHKVVAAGLIETLKRPRNWRDHPAGPSDGHEFRREVSAMIKRGVGMACGGHPTGMHGGADTNQAQISLEMDGTFDLVMGTVDIGQGCKTSFRQVAAEELDVPVESITYINRDTDGAPMCLGAFASRAMFIGGNAAIAACRDLKAKIKAFSANMLGVSADELEMADNKVFVKADPDKALAMAQVGGASNFGGNYLIGSGAYMPEGGPEGEITDPETGAMPHLASIAYTACIVEVEVDTDTGMVRVVKETHGYELGQAINPLACKEQINGGAAMGYGLALTEDVHPYWPSLDFAADGFESYVITTAADVPSKANSPSLKNPIRTGRSGPRDFARARPMCLFRPSSPRSMMPSESGSPGSRLHPKRSCGPSKKEINRARPACDRLRPSPNNTSFPGPPPYRGASGRRVAFMAAACGPVGLNVLLFVVSLVKLKTAVYIIG